jgi:hypothetical protein
VGCQIYSSGIRLGGDVLTSFFTLLYSINLERDREDKLWWSPSHKGKFDVTSFHKALAFKETSHFP